ncbi:PilZ domain-containing protein [Oceanispirochaeta crateris]|uniref:PilZ domain-containing protein n=1 Tax=Oceanispirochaeta crateris TaxID=2518645 RepID=A0A5C1QIS8_9SPIO|nr:PilZ domain-containing protein [Oceanispirochaeta crateris]QEN07208.1 PilZ domain-containing protein [Oceanispirochaeta crateris]
MFITLLQSSSRFKGQLFTPSDPKQNLIFLAVMGISLLFLIIGNKLSNGSNAKNKRYSKRAFRREGTRVGLTKKQIALLESFIKVYHVNKPFDLLSNTRTLNNTLSQALRDISHMEAPPSVVEERKLNIYRIKQRIERVFAETNQITDTRKLKLSQNVTFKMDNGNRYSSVITANLKEFYCARVPIGKKGSQVKWPKGTRLTILIWGADGEEYTFTSKVLGYNSVKGITSVFLQHSNKISRAYQRKFRRKQIKRPCYIFPIKIQITGSGKRERKEAVVLKNKGRMGTLIDLSAGGCSLQTTSALNKGELIKLSFEPIKGSPVVTYGKIVDTRSRSRIYTSIHIMFTRASSKNLNRINEYVYDFE